MRPKNLFQHIQSLWNALQLTGSHLYQSIRSAVPKNRVTLHQDGSTITLQYPHEKLPIPDRGRYKLHNAIEDCIVCDKCAKICPVDCIEIEAIPAPDVIGTTSNGMKKRIHAAKFDIDLAKCCFCGLCTTVCPTDCLTMTSEYDFSVFDVLEHKISFAEMNEQEIIEKKQIWAEHLAHKNEAAKPEISNEPTYN
ncbi:MAG: 4Fe-4S ferredoxin [Candidatus Amoebophilus sp. 36-38]|nr:MAG: 4Fe-4S ferredoxin [Candidatus Amoebophilus sp. 36-38]